VNAVDDPANATAFLSGVVRRDGVTVAISTRGHAPALAGLLREALDAVLPSSLGEWMRVAREARTGWRRDGVPMEARRPLLLRALNRIYGNPSSPHDTEAAGPPETSVRLIPADLVASGGDFEGDPAGRRPAQTGAVGWGERS
jgi:siroheme synthase (precorrin-2 oxidase/ferrochelatase)